MKTTLNFVKEIVFEEKTIGEKTITREIGRKWYLDFPSWTGSKDDLEMVRGADKMLDIMAKGKDRVCIEASNTDDGRGDYIIAKLIAHNEHGGTYQILDFGKHFNTKYIYQAPHYPDEEEYLSRMEVPEFTGIFWLCNVTHKMFGDFYEIHPEMIFFNIIK